MRKIVIKNKVKIHKLYSLNITLYFLSENKKILSLALLGTSDNLFFFFLENILENM